MTEKELFEIENTRPHVVILGAGATIATIPSGDKNGRHCSVMHGFIKRLNLDAILNNVKLYTQSENIEDIYSELYERGEECKKTREQLEDAIYDYFSKLQLPDEITIYDKNLVSWTWKRGFYISIFNNSLQTFSKISCSFFIVSIKNILSLLYSFKPLI